MSSRRLIWISSALALLTSCGGKITAIEECGEDMGRADDGICYPLAEADDSGDDGNGAVGNGADGNGADGTGDDGTGDDGTGDDGTGDDGTGDDGTGDDGTGDDGTGDEGTGDGETGDSDTTGTIGLVGKLTFSGTTTADAICNISSWTIAAYDEETGQFDRSEYDEYDMQPVDCQEHTGGDIEFNLNITVDTSDEVLFFAFIDPDGDPSTNDYLAPANSNPMTVVLGENYTDILFEMPEPD